MAMYGRQTLLPSWPHGMPSTLNPGYTTTGWLLALRHVSKEVFYGMLSL